VSRHAALSSPKHRPYIPTPSTPCPQGADEHSTLHVVTHTHDSNHSATYLVGRQRKQGLSDPRNTLGMRGARLLGLAPRGAYVRLRARDGEAWAFSGRTWHAAANPTNVTRTAIQLHFMPAACRFRSQHPDGLGFTRGDKPKVIPLPKPDPSSRNRWSVPSRGLDARSIAAGAPGAAGAAAELAPLLPSPPASEAHDVCTFVAGAADVASAEWMLKSLRAASGRNVRLHVLASADAAAPMRALLDATEKAWESAELLERSEAELAAAAKAVLPGWRGGVGDGWRGWAQLLLPRFFTSVERCVFLDPSLLLAADVGALWAGFDSFTPSTLLKLRQGEGGLNGTASVVNGGGAAVHGEGSLDGFAAVLSGSAPAVLLMGLRAMQREDVWERLLTDAWRGATGTASTGGQGGTSGAPGPARLLSLALAAAPGRWQQLAVSWGGAAGPGDCTPPPRGCSVSRVMWDCDGEGAAAPRAAAPLYVGDVVQSSCLLPSSASGAYRPYEPSLPGEPVRGCPLRRGDPLARTLCELRWSLLIGLSAAPCVLRSRGVCDGGKHGGKGGGGKYGGKVKGGGGRPAGRRGTGRSLLQQGKGRGAGGGRGGSRMQLTNTTDDPLGTGRSLLRQGNGRGAGGGHGQMQRTNATDDPLACLLREGGAPGCLPQLLLETMRGLENRLRRRNPVVRDISQ